MYQTEDAQWGMIVNEAIRRVLQDNTEGIPINPQLIYHLHIHILRLQEELEKPCKVCGGFPR